MTMLLNPFAYGGAGGGGYPANVIGYQSGPSGGVFDFQGVAFSGYQRVVLYLDGLTVSDTGDPSIRLQFYCGGVLQTASYRYETSAVSSSGGTPSLESGASTVASIIIAQRVQDDAGSSANIVVDLCNMDSSSLHKLVMSEYSEVGTSGVADQGVSAGLLEVTTAVDGLRVFASAGNINSGQAMLLAMPTS